MNSCAFCGAAILSQRAKKYCSKACAGRSHGRGGTGYVTDGRYRVRLRDGGWQHYARCLMEGHLGRDLASDEHVHHINGDKTDDRIENLEIVTSSEHFWLHVDELRVAITRSGKLNAEQIAEIKASTERTSVLARQFGVTDGAIVYHRGALLKAHGRGA